MNPFSSITLMLLYWISIPYNPTKKNWKSPEIVVWYIDGSGNAEPVPTGRYNAENGTV